MGKIVNALRVAHGEVAELVLKSIEESDLAESAGAPAAEAMPAIEPPVSRILPAPRPIPAQTESAPAAVIGAGETSARIPRIEPTIGRWEVRALPLDAPDAVPLLAAKPAHPGAAEQYRFVRTRIMHHAAAPGVIVISSPGIGDGKSVTSINLAGAFAQTGDEEVLLIDGDLRCSAVHEYLRVPRSPGLSEVLAGKCSLQEAIFRVVQIPSLCVLPAGEPEGNPTELLGSSRWPALVKTLRQHFHRLIVDCPPVEAVADFDLISAGCEAAILVVRPDRTNRVLCARAIEKARKKLLGVLMNCTADKAQLKQYLSHYASWRQEHKA